MKIFVFLALLILMAAIVAANVFNSNSKRNTSMNPIVHSYLPLGDSYTIGEKVPPESSWPNLLVKDLNEHGVRIVLIANPAKSGWTSQDLINNELPIFQKSNATFVSILIGTNDIVQGVSTDTYKKNLSLILDTVQQKLADPHKIILLTLPDFTVTPTGKKFVNSSTKEKILEFNQIIISEANKRGLSVADIYKLSQEMEGDYSLMARDWLHPSAKEYEHWEKIIFPVAFKMIR